MRKLILIGLTLVIVTSAYRTSRAQGPVTLPRTETFILSSENVGDDYRIFVSFPSDYDESDDSYPVLYVLDPQIFFATIVQQARLLRANQELPELLIVGIGYPEDVDQPLQVFRGRDYIPSLSFRNPGSEGPEHFLSFITEELQPHIDANYRTDTSDRALLGYSFSGEFTLYALAHEPDAFERYIALSPAMPWTEFELQRYSDNILPGPEFDRVRLYISVGSLEGTDPVLVSYLTKLRMAEYDNLELSAIVIPGASHYAGFGMGLIQGLLRAYCGESDRNECPS
jgi:predicted alpha/beta superfamily hydrolase